MNKKYFSGFVFVLLFLTLTSCFPQAIAKNGELKALGVFRTQAHDFSCDPAKAALFSGLALNLSRRPLTFSCGALSTQSILTITLQNDDKNPIHVIWNVQDPVSGGIITLNSDQARKKSIGNSGFLLLANGDYSGDFDLEWTDFAVLKGKYRLTTQ
jgi:hypothetical protein